VSETCCDSVSFLNMTSPRVKSLQQSESAQSEPGRGSGNAYSLLSLTPQVHRSIRHVKTAFALGPFPAFFIRFSHSVCQRLRLSSNRCNIYTDKALTPSILLRTFLFLLASIALMCSALSVSCGLHGLLPRSVRASSALFDSLQRYKTGISVCRI
jgi:hypothetical protein